jgi:hypothetical protein
MNFDTGSLRSFFLYDVLLHEIGHHINQRGRGVGREKVALWSVEFQSSRIRDSAT